MLTLSYSVLHYTPIWSRCRTMLPGLAFYQYFSFGPLDLASLISCSPWWYSRSIHPCASPRTQPSNDHLQVWASKSTQIKHSIDNPPFNKRRNLPATLHSINFTACFRLSMIFQNLLFNVREGQPPCFSLISKRKIEKHFTKISTYKHSI